MMHPVPSPAFDYPDAGLRAQRQSRDVTERLCDGGCKGARTGVTKTGPTAWADGIWVTLRSPSGLVVCWRRPPLRTGWSWTAWHR